MAEIKLRFDITFTRRFVTTASALAMMLCAVPELESESVTLSTYYPAPSGVYTNMITTGNTFLARDNGNASRVGIGLTNPSVKLDVAQNGALKIGQAFLSSGGNYLHLATNEWYDGGQWWNSGLTAGALMQMNGSAVNFYTHDAGLNPNHTTTMSLDSAGSLTTYVASAGGGNITVGGNLNITGTVNKIDTNAPVLSRQGVSGCNAPASVTYPTSTGGSQTVCGGGYYVTTMSGFYTKYIAIPVDRGPNIAPPVNPSASFICCPCPTGGCVL